MKKKIFILIAGLVIVAVLLYSWKYANTSKDIYKSPDGLYIIEVSAVKRAFTMPGDGGTANTPALIVLKNRKGKIIAKSSDNPDCGIFLDSVTINWDLENNLVWYGKAKTINVKTGKVSC